MKHHAHGLFHLQTNSKANATQIYQKSKKENCPETDVWIRCSADNSFFLSGNLFQEEAPTSCFVVPERPGSRQMRKKEPGSPLAAQRTFHPAGFFSLRQFSPLLSACNPHSDKSISPSNTKAAGPRIITWLSSSRQWIAKSPPRRWTTDRLSAFPHR